MLFCANQNIFGFNIIVTMTYNLRKLLSISTQLSYEACQIIHKTLSDSSYKSFMKGEDDPVTDVDWKIQSMVITGLRKHFPDIPIIGEETQQFKGTIQYDYNKLHQDILPSNSKIQQQLQLYKSCLWIDPIDCTRGFLNGNIQDVTVLIGLSYQQKAIGGIIGTPFKKIGEKKVFDPTVTIGSVKQQQAFDFKGKQWVSKNNKYPINKPLKVATSNSRSSPGETNLIRTLKAENLKAGGSGRKIMMVANGEVDAMVYCQSWTHKWDSCAGDAIIKAMGGRFTTPWGSNIVYNTDRIETHNKQGMIAALDRQVHEKCMDAIAFF